MAPVEKYIHHLDKIFNQEPLFFGGGKDNQGLPNASVMIYENVPEPGFITGITYGLSLANHPEWIEGKPELCITVRASNHNWGLAASYLVNALRGNCGFAYGQTFNLSEKISSESEMDAFFLFAPAILTHEQYANIDIGLDYKINIVGLYPMYSHELETFSKHGLSHFWNHPHFDMFSINRKKITE
jgi:hypothetical protein